MNIFEQTDEGRLKREILAAIGYSTDLVPAEEGKTLEMNPSQKSVVPYHKPNVIDYLNKGKCEKESAKDFINTSRQILMSKISINLKKDENERLQEYITMEQEKLLESQKFLTDDKERFDQLITMDKKIRIKLNEEAK